MIPDDIYYEFIKQLPNKSLQLLLRMYNNICTNDNFPEMWRQSLSIPNSKPGMDETDSENDRPIWMADLIPGNKRLNKLLPICF